MAPTPPATAPITTFLVPEDMEEDVVAAATLPPAAVPFDVEDGLGLAAAVEDALAEVEETTGAI